MTIDIMKSLKQTRVGVLMGGLSNEREISLATGEAVAASLVRQGVDCVKIDAKRDLAKRLLEEKVGLAFIALHGRYGEDGCVQGLLELMDIPYTGSRVAASAIAMSKRLTKIYASAADMPTPPWIIVSKRVFDPSSARAPMAPPAVVKPANGGSSVNVTIVMDEREMIPAISRALMEDDEAIVERYIDGKQLTVGVLAGQALPAIEIEPIQGFYDYANKYTPGNTIYHLPARVDDDTAALAGEMALKMHRELGCRGQTRSDFILDDSGRLWFIEINTIPGMTRTSLLPKAADHAGISFDELVFRIIAATLQGGGA